jgi:hypothetical protein
VLVNIHKKCLYEKGHYTDVEAGELLPDRANSKLYILHKVEVRLPIEPWFSNSTTRKRVSDRWRQKSSLYTNDDDLL